MAIADREERLARARRLLVGDPKMSLQAVADHVGISLTTLRKWRETDFEATERRRMEAIANAGREQGLDATAHFLESWEKRDGQEWVVRVRFPDGRHEDLVDETDLSWLVMESTGK